MDVSLKVQELALKLATVESYDLSGKIIVPFATSGSSGIGKTSEKLRASCPGAKLLGGRVFKSSASAEDLAEWANDLLR